MDQEFGVDISLQKGAAFKLNDKPVGCTFETRMELQKLPALTE